MVGLNHVEEKGFRFHKTLCEPVKLDVMRGDGEWPPKVEIISTDRE